MSTGDETLSLAQATSYIRHTEAAFDSDCAETRVIACKRAAAIMAVKAAPHCRFSAPLTHALCDKNADVRAQASISIAQSVRENLDMATCYAPSIAMMLNNETDWLARCAMMAMVPRLVQNREVEGQRFVPGLSRALGCEDVYVASEACKAVKALVRTNKDTAESFAPGLQKALRHKSADVYLEAVMARKQMIAANSHLLCVFSNIARHPVATPPRRPVAALLRSPV